MSPNFDANFALSILLYYGNALNVPIKKLQQHTVRGSFSPVIFQLKGIPDIIEIFAMTYSSTESTLLYVGTYKMALLPNFEMDFE